MKAYPVFQSFVRLFALGFLLLSLQKAWAGVWLYQGEMLLKDQKLDLAFSLLEKAHRWDPENPDTLYELGQSALTLGIDKENSVWIEKGQDYFKKLNQKLPYFGHATFYLAQSQLELARKSSRTLTSEEWSKIETWIDQAKVQEPGSPWMEYMTAVMLLSAENLWLTPEKKQQALRQIKNSISSYYPEQVSPHLEPAYNFLWNRFSDFSFLKEVTPPEEASYANLLRFMDQHHLWEYRNQVYSEFLEINKKTYKKRLAKAQVWLARKDFIRALEAFEKTYWTNKLLTPAKAGILICQHALNKLPDDYLETVKEILENEEDPLGQLKPDFRKLMKNVPDPYLQGLYAFYTADFNKAKDFLEHVPDNAAYRFRRRYLAAAYWKSGLREEAMAALIPTLQEKELDLRELFLFLSWPTPYRKAIRKKISEVVTLSRSSQDWTGWASGEKLAGGKLNQNGRLGVMANFKPGKTTLHFSFQSFPDAEGALPYLLVRIWDQKKENIVGGIYASGSKADLNFKTSGGWRWVEAELLNGVKDPTQSGPILELGTLEIEHGS
ncbi:MAG: hypothetical protein HYZ83_02495 [Candidatus Omnitrophica bacterium]|nr:hypothetical protein [Candidatus Omnitrophota bacterium]